MTPLALVVVRFLFTLICSIAFGLYLVASQGSVFVKKDANGIKPTPVPYARPPFYTADSPFYVNHLVATVSEWVVAICFQAFLLTLTWEMSDYHLHAPKTRYVGRRKPFDSHANGAASKSNGQSKTNGHVFPAKEDDDALSWRL
ncbi:hypothetical protein AAVH_38736 [Aphelenchoides avenae]|nr:hypothetical protein AAVH_38736 [Aphelenchus avenae]